MKKLLIIVVLAALFLVSVACNRDSAISEEEQLSNEIYFELSDEEDSELAEFISDEFAEISEALSEGTEGLIGDE